MAAFTKASSSSSSSGGGISGIRTRHPEWDADRVAQERRAMLLGRELAERLEEWREAGKL